MKKISEKEWVEDFQEFVKQDGVEVPANVTETIMSKVRHDLNPSAWVVFAKLLGIHAVVGTLSLAICNQFGISPFQTGFSLSDYFMKFGHSACMVLCGVLFVGLSVSLGRLVVRPEEFKVLKVNAWLQVFGLSMVSLGIFAAVGAEITLALGALWLVGAMFGGTAIAMLPRRQILSAP